MLIVGGANTASKQSHRFPSNYPKLIEEGDGCYVLDDQGNWYIDFMCSLGPISLGYRYDRVDMAVSHALMNYGTIFSLPHRMEEELAEILCEMIPSAERVRLTHNGKDCTEIAIRLARHITGKQVVLSFSYHGAVDNFMACTQANNGVPECLKNTIFEFDYNDMEHVERLFKQHEVACVILEPHTIRKPTNQFLEKLRAICTKNNALLIFDEVVSFPRYPKFSAQAYFNVIPDLTCISKGMANGYPISALVGKKEFMDGLKDGGVFASTTFGGNLIGVSAAIATLNEFREMDVPRWIEFIGATFRNKVKDNKYFTKTGYAWRQFFEYRDKETQTKFLQELIKEGVFMGIPIFFNFSMDSYDIDLATKAINRVIDRMEDVKLEGEEIKEVFKKR